MTSKYYNTIAIIHYNRETAYFKLRNEYENYAYTTCGKMYKLGNSAYRLQIRCGKSYLKAVENIGQALKNEKKELMA